MPPRAKLKNQRFFIVVAVVLTLFLMHRIGVQYDLFQQYHYNFSSPYSYQEQRQIMREQLIQSQTGLPEPLPMPQFIHLDLKGAPPTVSYLQKFFLYIKDLGVKGVFIEYEDMFPYEGELEVLRAFNAYEKSDIQTILKLAEENDLEVIPLIQTFGHMEFVLKSEKYMDLREVEIHPEVVCPTNTKTPVLIRNMVDQILKAHPKAKYLHIGCDEVYYMGLCDRCQKVLEKSSIEELFLSHVKDTAAYINKSYPGVRPIIWDDMMRKTDEKILLESGISDFVDIIFWRYMPDLDIQFSSKILRKYVKVFKNIWIAGAFKGATGPNKIVTRAEYHLENIISWMKFLYEWKNEFEFKGMLLTGWQRYDHFSVLCELLPVGIPSLVLLMQYLRSNANDKYSSTTKSELNNIRDCYTGFDNPVLGPECSDFGKCNFPGHSIFVNVVKFYCLSSEIYSHFSKTSQNSAFSVYTILHNFGSSHRIIPIFKNWNIKDQLWYLKILEKKLRKELSTAYDDYTVEEWITTYVLPVRIQLEAVSKSLSKLLSNKVWPRRPFLNGSEELENIAAETCSSDKSYGCALILLGF